MEDKNELTRFKLFNEFMCVDLAKICDDYLKVVFNPEPYNNCIHELKYYMIHCNNNGGFAKVVKGKHLFKYFKEFLRNNPDLIKVIPYDTRAFHYQVQFWTRRISQDFINAF